ncbi:hypothetical protein N9H57_04105 [Flavobacteriaceae bacterium]|nr:hypothetical protein [Flavobacteriaceae bacterium]MDA9015972.1 hypothetical protein [Flavobacteriaceae bacterium]MDB3862542.1 hypothetical protein [Flavobacteriaceae bacterium]MDC3354254.1 hypothetical protein [Flavobacteriaceae bacterium]
MVANLFRKTNFSSFLLSFLGTFLILFFFQTEQNFNVESLLSKSAEAFGKAAIIFLLVLTLNYFKSKDRFIKISNFLLLSFPLVLLFVPQQSIQFDGLLANVLILIAFLNLASSENSRSILKPLFNAALIVSFLLFLEASFAFLFISLALLLFTNKTKTGAVLTAIVVPFLCTYFLMKTQHIFFGHDLWSEQWIFGTETHEFNVIELIVFLGFVLFFLVMTLFSKSAIRKIRLTIPILFLAILILIAIGVWIVKNEGPFNSFELIFFPLVYFISILLEEQSNTKINTVVVFLFLVKGGSFFLNLV